MIRKVKKTIIQIILVVLTSFLLVRMLKFVSEMRYVVAAHKSDTLLIYNDKEYTRTPFNYRHYDIEKKLGTVRGRLREWPFVFLMFQWDRVYSIKGDEEEQFLAVMRYNHPSLYCRTDIKHILKTKDGWDFTVGEVTGVKLDDDPSPIIVSEQEKILYLQDIMMGKTQIVPFDGTTYDQSWRVSFSYHNLPIYDWVGRIYEVKGEFIVHNKDDEQDAYYKVIDDGRLKNILNITSKKMQNE